MKLRCKLSNHGKQRLYLHSPHKRDRLGTIIGEGHRGTCWQVTWEGQSAKSKNVIHKDFIEVVADDPIDFRMVCEVAKPADLRGNQC